MSSDTDLKIAAERINQLVHECNSLANQISHTSAVLSTPGMVFDAATLHLIESIPAITELQLPILKEEASNNLTAISPYCASLIHQIASSMQNPKYDKNRQLHSYANELVENLEKLKIAQNEVIRTLFVNRGKILAHDEKNNRGALHAMSISVAVLEITPSVLTTCYSFFKDLKLILEL